MGALFPWLLHCVVFCVSSASPLTSTPRFLPSPNNSSTPSLKLSIISLASVFANTPTKNNSDETDPLTIAIVGWHYSLQTGIIRALRERLSPDTALVKSVHLLFVVECEEQAERAHVRAEEDGGNATIYVKKYRRGMKEADVVVLACLPCDAKEILGGKGVGEALAEKLVISFLPALTAQHIQEYISSSHTGGNNDVPLPYVVRATTNAASMVCKALTVVEEAEHVPQDAKAILDWVLGLVGKVKYLSRYSFASGSLMTELSMAMIANVLDGIYVAAEINRLHGQTLELEADMLEGLLAMMRAGYDPRTVRFLTISSNHYVDEVLESITNRGAGRGLFYNKLTAVLYHMHSLETQSSDLRFEKERSAHEKEVNGSASKECVLM